MVLYCGNLSIFILLLHFYFKKALSKESPIRNQFFFINQCRSLSNNHDDCSKDMRNRFCIHNLYPIDSLPEYVTFLNYVMPIQKSLIFKGDIILITKPEYIPFCLFFLKGYQGAQFKILSMITGTDLYDLFEVSYELLSIKYNSKIRIKAYVGRGGFSIHSICNIHSSANWWEREIWDMFGIYFVNHPDLRRLLTDYGFEGFPLRKDFPYTGFVEARYDITIKRVLCEPIEITQNSRYFNYESPFDLAIDQLTDVSSIYSYI